MKLKNLLFFALLILIFGCKKKDSAPVNTTNPLDNLLAGRWMLIESKTDDLLTPCGAAVKLVWDVNDPYGNSWWSSEIRLYTEIEFDINNKLIKTIDCQNNNLLWRNDYFKVNPDLTAEVGILFRSDLGDIEFSAIKISTDHNTFTAILRSTYVTIYNGLIRKVNLATHCIFKKISNDALAYVEADISSGSDISATFEGNVVNKGGAEVTARGVCWNTSTNPTISNNKTSDGSGTGKFTSSITGLIPNTIYYVRSYATNANGTGYSNEVSFTTNQPDLVISTISITSITSTSAITGGSIYTNNGANVITRGVCWSTSTNPTITNNKTIDGLATSSFTSSITGLSANTKYYVRAYGTNAKGTSYGNEISFTTNQVATPTLTTISTSSITQTSAISGGNVTSDGGVTITARGVCWSTSTNPTIVNSKTTDGNGSGTFISQITGLTLGNSYYVRAYATNSMGTAYGNQISFTTILTIGELYLGGKVAYILQSGDPGYIAGQIHGLIAAPSDQSTGIQWYNGSNVSTGASATAIGTGNANTNTIVSIQGVGSYAAKLCSDLVLGGYSDWYLPSKDELNKLYLNMSTIGGFTSDITVNYWCSSENGLQYSWDQNFYYGYTSNIGNKNNTYRVRAVRSF